MDEAWKNDAPVLTVDAGDLFGRRNKNEQHQTRFLCEVTGDLGYDGIGLGEYDLNYGMEFLREMMQEFGLPFTNANVRDTATGELILPEYLVVEKNGIKFGIISVLDPSYKIMTMTADDPGLEVLEPIPVLRDLVPRVRQEVDTVLLLSHLGESPTDVAIKEVKGIDLCVIGHTFRNLNTERIVDDTMMMAAAYEGRYVGRADLFVDAGDGQIMAIDVNVTGLDENIADDQEILARVEAYKASLEEFKEAKRADFPRTLGSAKETFLGDRSCMGCHREAWDAYAQSTHRNAFSTIRAKGQNFEPECLSCHTTGYRHLNGYADAPPYNKLINVQCEACHGYGTEHARDGRWAARAKDSCVTCHDQKNSPDFDYATYWEKIKH